MKVLGAKLFLFSLAFSLQGCAFSFFEKVNIELNSEPSEAEVFVIRQNSPNISLGKTPLKLPEDLSEKTGESNLQLLIVKNGFVSQRVFLDVFNQGKSGNISVKLEALADWTKSYDDKEASFYLNEVASSVAKIQADVANKKFEEALRSAEALNNKFPNLSTGWVLKGNILYLQNRKGDALKAYRKSMGIDPTNQDTKNIIQRIEDGGTVK